MPLALHEKILLGYGCVFVAGGISFYSVKQYVLKNRPKILASKARMRNALLEDYIIDDKFSYTERYQEQQNSLKSQE